MAGDFNLNVLWPARKEDCDSAAFAAKLQRFCRALSGVDEGLAGLKRGSSKVNFADLPIEKAIAFVRRDAFVTGLRGSPPTSNSLRVNVNRGNAPSVPGKVRVLGSATFWKDEARVRRATAALIDFWDAEQACVSTSRLPGMEWDEDTPWFFWLDWRRAQDTPTLLPHVPVAGQPSIKRAWHGGVERLWPEYAPWNLLGAEPLQP